MEKLPDTVKLVIRCCGIYRAHWDDESYYNTSSEKTLLKKTNSSRVGLKKLLSADRIFVKAMDEESWDEFMEFCSSEINITKSQWKFRDNYDNKISAFLEKLRKS